ncbi:hypothetical protein MKX50_24825 [Paenibacillus sp. FSL W8-0186]|uniref:DUF4179 domain-containing protein n=1 Tax=Paenibacillus woosongensis TaxID=307580 RepID=A0ABQ4MT21_9BACL|nr:hypothetical protein [Paenibacillus woosongensis]GIP59035.1 hypothetical protein J15TS10_28490 [Paenibacillus woosongensis]
MKKKSKVLMIGASLAAVSMFSVAAFASTPEMDGYKAFKEVLKANQMSEQTMESATVNGNFAVTLNGETVLEADGLTKFKAAGDKHSASSDFDFTLKGVERSGSVYSSGDDTAYLVDRTHGLDYQVINLDDEHAGKHHAWKEEGDFEHRPMTKAEEALLDFIVGDLKDNFSVVNHADHSKTISVDVSKEEVPLVVRLLMDVASADGRKEHSKASEVPAEWESLKQIPFFQGLEAVNLEEQLPELTEEVTIEHLRLQLTVDADNRLQGVQGKLEVSGKDKAGVIHRVKMEGEGGISGINATTPDVYDPAGKSIEIIDAEAFEGRG